MSQSSPDLMTSAFSTMAFLENITVTSFLTNSSDVNGTKPIVNYMDPSFNGFGYKSEKDCLRALGPYAKRDEQPYCPGVFDTVLCWPAAPANSKAELPCPAIFGLDIYEKAYRNCGPDGLWESKTKGVYVEGVGHSHYIPCYTEAALEYYNRYLANKSEEEKRFIKNAVIAARTLETVGLSISLVATIISLIIFWYFRSLKCHRTRIHKNLFVAIIVQITVKIIQYVDQIVARESGGEIAGASSGDSNTIFDTPVFCEIMYCLYEYTKTVKFMWMFIEGLYLHNMIAISVFSLTPNYHVFYSIGWGAPVILIIAWAIPMAMTSESKCWAGYYNSDFIWIIEAPRAAVMCINLFFLLNIIRVLVVKLRESQTTEASQVRKAVKAAIVLLPLLGLTNFVIMLEPDGTDRIKLCIYLFSSAILTAFEGYFIALLYCFLNGEVQNVLRRLIIRHTAYYATDISAAAWRVNTFQVRQTLRRQWERYRQHRLIHNSSLRRLSRSLSIFTSFTEVPHSSHGQNPKANGSEGANGHKGRSNIYRGSNARRQSSRDVNNSLVEPQSNIELPDRYNCSTDLMSEDKMHSEYV